MPLVSSRAPYAQFTAGRSVSSAVHREDDSLGDVAGFVDEAGPGDTEITAAEYDAIVSTVQAYNAALPQPAPPDPRDPLEARFTPAERKALRALLA
jgi:hypothetical protein|tara:strand:+ start:841 stop:1128 length:288 start_codon:yes stop_codon:yes gene_type:complete